jgi:LCP family protein required for cell wall assembly
MLHNHINRINHQYIALFLLMILLTACQPAAAPATPARAPSAAPEVAVTDLPTTIPATATAAPSPTPTIHTVCGQSQPLFILGLGVDDHEQADAIRLIRVDFLTGRVLVLSFPRDTWLPITGLADEGITEGRINATYGYGETFNGPGKGADLLADTLNRNYGVTFDRWFSAHFSLFVNYIDSLGGVDIDLAQPIGGYGFKGKLHLNGREALVYVRQRANDSDLYRIQRQAEVMKGLFRKLSQPQSITALPELAASLLDEHTFLTNLTAADVASLVCLAAALREEDIVFLDIPPEYVPGVETATGAFIRIPAPEISDFIRKAYINGEY